VSKFGDQLAPPSQVRVTVGPVARPASALRYVEIAVFERMFACAINSLPQNVCLIGWLKSEQCWYAAPASLGIQRASHASFVFHRHGLERLLRLLSQHIVQQLDVPALWFPLCFYDAWRERNVFSSTYRWVVPPDLTDQLEWQGAPGEIPVLSPTRHWLACFGSHRGDPGAFLLPDPHYLVDYYARLFAELEQFQQPWPQRKPRTVFAAGDHGESRNLYDPPADRALHPRRLFRDVVVAQQLDVDVYLGQPFAQHEQLAYRYIVDVDGYARTWDAWAWKMMSGSTVLAVESPWVSFFSEQFSPWQHYVPVANNCSDLAERLAWCHNNETECEAIAQRAHDRAKVVYDPKTVNERVLQGFRGKLAEPLPADWPQQPQAAQRPAV